MIAFGLTLIVLRKYSKLERVTLVALFVCKKIQKTYFVNIILAKKYHIVIGNNKTIEKKEI